MSHWARNKFDDKCTCCYAPIKARKGWVRRLTHSGGRPLFGNYKGRKYPLWYVACDECKAKPDVGPITGW